MKLVFIHGRSQQGKDPVKLQETWEEAFDKGLENAGLSRPAGLEIAFPYYGDELDKLLKELDTPLVADINERGAEPDPDEAEFRGELLQELAAHAGITEDEIRANYEGDVQHRGVANWEWVHSILKAFDKSEKVGELVLDAFTRDVYVYLTKKAVSRRIDAIVSPHITDEPCVVVGHSLGSIVGYNVLRNTSNKVVRYVTVGSPLGIQSIKRKLKSPLDMPATTGSWFNAMDEGDVVALYPLDKDHFPIDPAIKNKTDVQNPTDNQHGIIGYLPDVDVARAIMQALVD